MMPCVPRSLAAVEATGVGGMIETTRNDPIFELDVEQVDTGTGSTSASRARTRCGSAGAHDVTDDDRATVVATERWLIARGTPHLIEGYNATEDVFTRALPLFTIVFLLELSVALSSEWTWWQNLLAAVGAFALAARGVGAR